MTLTRSSFSALSATQRAQRFKHSRPTRGGDDHFGQPAPCIQHIFSCYAVHRVRRAIAHLPVLPAPVGAAQVAPPRGPGCLPRAGTVRYRCRQARILKAAGHAVYTRTHQTVGSVPSIHTGTPHEQVAAPVPDAQQRGPSPRSAAEGIGLPGQVCLDTIFVEIVQPIGGGDGVAQAPAVVDAGVHVLQGDGGRGVSSPGEQELQAIEVMDRGGGAVGWV
jgi:hypothetical protein